MTNLNAVITGITAAVPDYILTNEELSRMVDTSDEWIMTRVGIKERRILKGEEQGLSLIHISLLPLLYAAARVHLYVKINNVKKRAV